MKKDYIHINNNINGSGVFSVHQRYKNKASKLLLPIVWGIYGRIKIKIWIKLFITFACLEYHSVFI